MSRRASGLLLHPTSLPGRFGVGDLGGEVDRFLDWMVEAGLSVWQVLPLHPPAVGNSPYGASSCFAGDPALISLSELVALGLLDDADLDGFPEGLDAGIVHHAADRGFKRPRLRRAWERFRESGDGGLVGELAAFRAREAGWLDDWALFATLASRSETTGWLGWEESLRGRDPEALAAVRQEHRGEIAFHVFLQFLFDRQWARVRREAASRGIRILGDLPIYVNHQSAEVWARPDLFDLDDDGRPRAVAGCPPDYFAETGQLWGNPLYRWDRMAEEGYRWWIERLRGDLRWCDLVRLDHFRGFVAYWRVPAGEETAIAGSWEPGPGRALFDAVADALADALGGLPIVAEDLGEITDDVFELRDALDLPGMVVLQFGFENPETIHAPHHHRPRRVVYTGTHDNDTAEGWYAGLDEVQRATVDAYLGRSAESASPIHRDLVRCACASVAEWAIFPAQDVLGLGGSARTNVPGRAEGNWRWRLRPGQLDATAAAWLRELGRLTDRPGPAPAG